MVGAVMKPELPTSESAWPSAVAYRVPTSLPRDLPHWSVSDPWPALLDGGARAMLERRLPAFLRRQRWFGSKARKLVDARLLDWVSLPAGSTWLYLAFAEVHFEEGEPERYFVPLSLVNPEDAGRPELQGRMLAHLRSLRGEALLVDALADETACAALRAAIAAGRDSAACKGAIRIAPTSAYQALRGPGDMPLRIAPGPATSSNSLVRFGNKLLLKVFRRLEEGINPDLEIGLFLTERTDFRAIPRVAGTIEYECPGCEPVTLAILQEMIGNHGDGWQHALDELRGYYERVQHVEPAFDDRDWLDLADRRPNEAVEEAIGPYLDTAARLGQRTAELHLALASNASHPAFAPEPITGGDLWAWAASAAAHSRDSLVVLQRHLAALSAEDRLLGAQVLDEAPALMQQLGEIARTRFHADKIRCHGDYHLGQVLRVDDDFVILDFEGEPARPIKQRRAKQSPLKDVAGMLRSFSYAAYAGLFERFEGRQREASELIDWAELWQKWCSAIFLKEYRRAAGSASFLPSNPDKLARLLRFFMLDKVFYELAYELNSRPDWVRIPLQGILSLRETVTDSAPIGKDFV